MNPGTDAQPVVSCFDAAERLVDAKKNCLMLKHYPDAETLSDSGVPSNFDSDV
jgi:hypothetical protein